MSTKLVAHRYATALLLEAEAQKKIEVVENDLHVIAEIVAASPDLRILLRSPIFENWRKKKIILEVFKDQISELTLSFLVLVIEKNREMLTQEIVKEFHAQLDAMRSIVRVGVETATQLDTQSRDQLTKGLSAKLGGRTIAATYEIDKELLGGIRVTVGDMVYDGSLRQQLDALREKLATA